MLPEQSGEDKHVPEQGTKQTRLQELRADERQRQLAGLKALDALTATYTEEQRRLALAASDARTGYWVAYVDRVVEHIAVHFPGLRLAILAISDHVQADGADTCTCGEID